VVATSHLHGSEMRRPRACWHFAAFGVAFLMNPIGGFVFGRLGDTSLPASRAPRNPRSVVARTPHSAKIRIVHNEPLAKRNTGSSWVVSKHTLTKEYAHG